MLRIVARLALVSTLGLIGACADDSDSGASNSSETGAGPGDGDGDLGDGDGDGDPETGDGDGDPGTGDGDGDGDPGTGDGDGDPGTGDGDGDTGAGDGDGDNGPICDFDPDPSESATFSFIDTPGDDIPQDAIKLFFEGLPELCASDYMFFQILGGNGEGAWCSARGDWYVTTYLEVYGQHPTIATGPFEMWTRNGDASQEWQESFDLVAANHYGGGCGQFAGDWCGNWGVNGVTLGVMPESPQNLDGSELRDSSPSDGEGWEFTLTWGRSREAACGF